MRKRLVLGLVLTFAGPVGAAGADGFSVDASGTGSTSIDGGTTTVPFTLTVTDNTAIDGSKSISGYGFYEEATMTNPIDIAAFAGGNGSGYAAPGVLEATVHGLAFLRTAESFAPRLTASFGGSFTDTIHLEGSGLAPATPVSYHGHIHVSAGQFGAYYYSGFGYPTGTFYLQYGIGSASQFYSFPTPGFSDLPDLHFDIDFDLSGSVGDTVPISCSLGLGVQNRAGSGYGDQQETTLNASEGVHFYLEPTTPGLVITSDSGHDYTAVPEPAGAAAVAGGALLALARGRRTGGRTVTDRDAA
jgi:hypothetical protein